MSNIEQVIQIDFKQLFIWLGLILLTAKILTDAFSGTIGKWLEKKGVKIETKNMREKREDHEKILDNAQAIKDLAELHKQDNIISNKHDEEIGEALSKFMLEVRSDIKELKYSMQESFDNSVKYRQISIEKEQNLNNRIDGLVNSSKQRDASVNDISNALNKLTTMFIDKEISDYRWEIINFATAISEKKPCSKEAFRHCFATYEKYEKILEENGLENGEVTASMEIITETYKKKLLEGF